MEDSQPLRRSTRNSVVLKNEELTPRKRKVSTPVKVEPSTPSRRTRASSATPKKNLIEVMNTPKKTLPVLNEEENPEKSTRTPVKKTKEISPKTPSRRRLVRESVSTPTRVSVDRSTKKPVDTSEDTNVTSTRPLTRAKRKTMGEIQVAEVTKTESEKVVQNKKDKAESDKGVQNKKDKPSAKSASIDGKKNNSPDGKSDKKQDESCFAVAPRVVVADIGKQQLKKVENTENVIEENNCGVFTTKSPVRAEDIAINSPRKVPENCKSFSEASLLNNSRSQKITVDPANSITSLDNSDTISECTTSKSPIKTNLAITSPRKVSDSKDNDIPNIVTTSPQNVIDSKDSNIPNIVVTSPSPRKVMDSKDNDVSNIVSSSPQKVMDSKDNDISNIVVTSPSPRKVMDSKDNDISNIVSSSPQKVMDSKDNVISNIVVTSPSPRKVMDSKDNAISNIVTASPQKVPRSKSNDVNDLDKSFISEQKTSPGKNEKNSSIISADIDGKNIHEPSKPETLTAVKVDSEITNPPDEKKLIKENESNSPDERNEKETLSEKINENCKLSTEVSEKPQMEISEKCASNEVSLVDARSSKKVDAIENSISNEINEKNSVQAVMQVSSVEIPHIIKDTDINMEMSQTENKNGKELNKTFDKVNSNENILDSTECTIAKDVCAKKSAESDSHVLRDVNNDEFGMATNINESITKDMTLIEHENDKETNESKMNNSADETLELDASFLNESSVEKSPKEVDLITSSIPVVKEVGITKVKNEKSEKDEDLTPAEASPSSTDNTLSSAKKASMEVISTEALDKDKEVNELTTEVNMIQNNSEQVDKSLKEITYESSPVEPNKASSPKQSGPAENKSDVEKKIDGEEASGNSTEKNNENSHDSSSPLFFIRCECETSDDSGDSGIQNDDNVLVFKMSSQFKKLITSDEVNLQKNIPEQSNNEGIAKDVLKSDDTIAKDFDNVVEAHSEVNLEEGENISEALESGTSDLKCSPEKSDVNNVEKHPDTSLAMEEKTETIVENIPKSSESTEDCTDKISGLDEILMSPNDFLNSDEESNVDCEKIEDSQSKNGGESCTENKSSEEFSNTDHLQHSTSKIKDNVTSNVTLSCNASSEDVSIKVDEKQDDSDVTCHRKTEIIPIDSDKVEDTCIDKEKEEIISQKCEEENDESKSSSDDSSGDNNICQNKSEPVITEDVLEKTKSPKPSNSIEENENEVSKTEKNVQDSLNSSQTVCSSPEVEVEKSLEDAEPGNKQVGTDLKSDNPVKDSDSSEGDGEDIEKNLEPIKKNTKKIKNKRKIVSKKVQSETDSSQSDTDSESSSNPPSNAATEGSSDGPLRGKDFIDFEAEEGEETPEDDSFIVSSGESSASSSSDTPSFKMKKLRKRKRNLDSESADSCNYVESVQRLFDNSIDYLNVDVHEDSFIKKKKQKLEKVTTVNKKSRRPKSILRNKYTSVEFNRNKSKTENKVIKQSSKTGVFIISNISQNFEEQKLSQNSYKRSSKLRMEQKKSEISDEFFPKGFNVIDAGTKVVDDAALRGFEVSYDESYLVPKKPRKAVSVSSALISKKKKINEGKNIKKTIKKSTYSESKGDSKNEKISPHVVTLILPFSMTSRSVTSVLTELGLSDISSIDFPKPKVAIVEFSNKEPYKKILKLYGELKFKDRPIYILDGSSLF